MASQQRDLPVNVKHTVKQAESVLESLHLYLANGKQTPQLQTKLQALIKALLRCVQTNGPIIDRNQSFIRIMEECKENMKDLQYYIGEFHKASAIMKKSKGSSIRRKMTVIQNSIANYTRLIESLCLIQGQGYQNMEEIKDEDLQNIDYNMGPGSMLEQQLAMKIQEFEEKLQYFVKQQQSQEDSDTNQLLDQIASNRVNNIEEKKTNRRIQHNSGNPIYNQAERKSSNFSGQIKIGEKDLMIKKSASEHPMSPSKQFSKAEEYCLEAHCLLYGHGIEPNTEDAILWYERSANLGEPRALYSLGQIHEKGIGMRIDIPKACDYYKKAADLEEPNAKFKIAKFYQSGGVQQVNDGKADTQIAFKLILEGAEGGSKDAIRELGHIYEIGGMFEGLEQKFVKLVEINLDKALELYQKSFNLGDLASANLLGSYFFNHTDDHEKATYYFRLSTQDRKQDRAFNNLGICFEQGSGDIVQDFQEAIKLYEQSARHGYLPAYANLAYLYYQIAQNQNEFNGMDKDELYFQAATWLRMALFKNDKNVEVICLLAKFYEEGLSVDKNPQLAVKYYEKAAQLGNHKSLTKIGHLYYSGLLSQAADFYESNMNQSKLKCLDYYQKAVDLGDSEAANCLGLIYETGIQDLLEPDTNKAIHYYKKSISLDQCNSDPHFNMGLLLLSIDASKEEESLSHMKQAANLGNIRAKELDPLNESENFNLKLNYYKKKISFIKSYIEFTKDDFKKNEIKGRRKYFGKLFLSSKYQWLSIVISVTFLIIILIQSFFSPLMVFSNIYAYFDFLAVNMFLSVLMITEYIIHRFIFKKNYAQVQGQKGLLVTLIIQTLATVISISYYNQLLRNDEQQDGITTLEDIQYQGLFILGMHQTLAMLFLMFKYSEVKTRIKRVIARRKAQRSNQEDDEFYNQENALNGIEKVYHILREYSQRINENDHETKRDFELCLDILQQFNQQDNYNSILKRQGELSGPGQIKNRISQLNINSPLVPKRKIGQFSDDISSSLENNEEDLKLLDDSKLVDFDRDGRRKSISVRQGYTPRKEKAFDPLKLSKYVANFNLGIQQCLDKIESFSFDIFQLRKVSTGRELLILGYEIAHSQGLIEKNHINKFTYLNFLQGISQSYNNVAYHSKTHAADVLQGLHYFLKVGQLANKLNLNPLEHIGGIIAAMAHDVDHPGFNNQFLVATQDEIALLYNDQSVLENHHVAQTFMLLRQDELNIFKRFKLSDYNKIREIIIKMVLATDMFYHGQNMEMLNKIAEKAQQNTINENQNNNQIISFEEELQQNKIFLLGQALHIADISNPCRQWQQCCRWTDLVFREFFYQGDLERQMGLPISYLMDKKTVNIAQSQVGFINFLVMPVFTEFQKLCHGIEPLIQQMNENKQKWISLKDPFEFYKHAANDNQLAYGQCSMDDDFFSYENYMARKNQTTEQVLTPNKQISTESTQKKQHQSRILLNTNQRPSFGKRSSIAERISTIKESPKSFINQLGDEMKVNELMGEESSSGSESVSHSDIQQTHQSQNDPFNNNNQHESIKELQYNESHNNLLDNSPEQVKVVNNLIQYSDEESKRKEENFLTKSDQDMMKILKDQSIITNDNPLQINSNRFYNANEFIKDMSIKIPDNTISISIIEQQSIENNTEQSPVMKISESKTIQNPTVKPLNLAKSLRQNRTLMQRSAILKKQTEIQHLKRTEQLNN